jgi:RHS repeat-associated protein
MRIESQLGNPGGSFCGWSAAPWTSSLEPGVSTRLTREAKHAASNTYTSPTSPGSAPSDSVSTVLYQHADHLTTRVTTDNSGNYANAQAHYPYGESWYTDGTADPSPPKAGKFTSYRKETDSSLASGQINYAIARYHGARIGRFHRPDPVRGRISNPQRLNRYSYVGGDPVGRRDPRGLDWDDSATLEGAGGKNGALLPQVFVEAMPEEPRRGFGGGLPISFFDVWWASGGDLTPTEWLLAGGPSGGEWYGSWGSPIGLSGGSGGGSASSGATNWGSQDMDPCLKHVFEPCMKSAEKRKERCNTGIENVVAIGTIVCIVAGVAVSPGTGVVCEIVLVLSVPFQKENCDQKYARDTNECARRFGECYTKK